MFLELANGGPLFVDRVADQKNVALTRTGLQLCCKNQPPFLAADFFQQNNEQAADGFSDRFHIAVFDIEDHAVESLLSPIPTSVIMPEDIMKTAFNTCFSLDTEDKLSPGNSLEFVFSERAQAYMDDLLDILSFQRNNVLSDDIKDIFEKGKGHLARFAGSLFWVHYLFYKTVKEKHGSRPAPTSTFQLPKIPQPVPLETCPIVQDHATLSDTLPAQSSSAEIAHQHELNEQFDLYYAHLSHDETLDELYSLTGSELPKVIPFVFVQRASYLLEYHINIKILNMGATKFSFSEAASQVQENRRVSMQSTTTTQQSGSFTPGARKALARLLMLPGKVVAPSTISNRGIFGYGTEAQKVEVVKRKLQWVVDECNIGTLSTEHKLATKKCPAYVKPDVTAMSPTKRRKFYSDVQLSEKDYIEVLKD
eukprot:GCRY01004938.1.p1 GENE.GCRY01004938.1~~GCRY01004938.1.p1  ORF type:complete len:423 (+),score=66.77 GCRY01004938.1:509-1777(+)